MTCKYNGSNKASGIDHLIFCFEAGFDNSEHDDHFPSRSSTYTTSELVTEPSGWDEDDMRTLWHKNIFNVSG